MALILPRGSSYERVWCLLRETQQVCHLGHLITVVKWRVCTDQHGHTSEPESLRPKCFRGQKCMSWTCEAEGEEG